MDVASVLLWASAGLVLASGILKTSRFGTFLATVDDYKLLPKTWSRPVARLAIVIEVACAALLVFPGAIGLVGVAGTVTVLVAGALAATHNLAIGNTDHACGCFAEASGRLTWLTPIRALSLAGAIVVVKALADPLLQAAEFALALAATGGFALAALAILSTRALAVQSTTVLGTELRDDR